jgi:farnesyl-diphosphate farnesyltransferase
VIRQLPKGLCLDILIFYLALRALDTIEDDMEAFKGREEVKIQHLNTFYKTGLVTDGWTMQGVGEGDERTLLEEFHKCVSVFKSLLPQSQAVIADITKRMGQGMASYVQKDLGQGTVTVKDYDLYCHYVAGLVGEGLSRLFVCTGYESPKVAGVATTLANTMGLFLQKTNIIRDYLEDYVDGRAFWPQEIWKGYTTTKELGELAEQKNRVKAVECLNHLVTNALECVPECLAYIGLLQTAEVFRFCAIPQVMAIATLAELYNNPKVFTGVVKIRKGQTCCLFLDSGTVEGVHKWFNILAKSIRRKIDSRDPNAAKTRAICDKIVELTASKTVSARLIEGASTANFVACWVLAATTYVLLCRDERHLKFIRSLDSGSLFSLSPHAPWRTLFGSCKTYIFSLSSSSCRLDQACLFAAVVSILVIFAYSLSTSRKVFKVASDLDKSA